MYADLFETDFCTLEPKTRKRYILVLEAFISLTKHLDFQKPHHEIKTETCRKRVALARH